MYTNNFYFSWFYFFFCFQGSRVPTLKINLGPRIDTTGSSNGGLSGSSSKHHSSSSKSHHHRDHHSSSSHHHKSSHRKHKKSKKQKKHIDSDDDDDIVELSNGSDEDYRVWFLQKNKQKVHFSIYSRCPKSEIWKWI